MSRALSPSSALLQSNVVLGLAPDSVPAAHCVWCAQVHLDAGFWLRRLYLHFIFRQQGMLQWFRPTFEGITRLAPPSLCHMHFHYTGAAAGAADNLLIQVCVR